MNIGYPLTIVWISVNPSNSGYVIMTYEYPEMNYGYPEKKYGYPEMK